MIAAGDELDARSAAHSAALDRQHRSPRRIAGIAAAGLVAASVAALVVIANIRDGSDRADTSTNDPATAPDASATSPSVGGATTPSPTGLDPATFPGVHVCADALDEYRAPGAPATLELPDVATAEILLVDIPDHAERVRVLFAGDGAAYSCTVRRDIEAGARSCPTRSCRDSRSAFRLPTRSCSTICT